eukprot:TRINITY_DN8661_c0_g1_i6.p1 TRINITY_DN8661_c0_g1~~TRINITY_DN8661_c0_g1_i6.p1  ORF type:complete len:220 (+),score=22.14 TRINITY_DN8661_c0_g1_i6:570-1229(+)
MHLQYCAVLSQQNKHGEALTHAKLGAKCVHMGICELEGVVEAAAVKFDATLLETTARKLLPILRALISYLIPEEQQHKIQAKKDIKIRSLFGFLPCLESVMGLNMGGLVQLSPLSLIDILSEYDLQYELSRESLFERIALLVIAYFCISTETRFIAQMANAAPGEAEFFHARALEIACKFLPAECSLTTHMYMTYQKHYSVTQQIIVNTRISHSQKIPK